MKMLPAAATSLRCNSELSEGIFEEAKGLLMNRPFIDLWTKLSLIMCGVGI